VDLAGGASVVTSVSGQPVKVSGETIVSKVSGETVLALVSGQTVTVASGLYVSAQFSATLTLSSGSVIIGDSFSINSGSVSVSSGQVTAKVSGEVVSVASGAEIIWRVPITSGSVIVSGNVGTSVSGNVVLAKISGETLQVAGVASGLDGAVGFINYTTYDTTEKALDVHVRNTSILSKVSGETVIGKISGNVVSIASGAEIIWRASVTSSSGNIIVSKVSGEVVSTASGLEIIWRIPITSGSVIVSGSVKISGETVVSASGSEIIWRVPITSGSVIVSGNVGITTSGIEIIWRVPITSGSVIVSGTVTSKVSGETVVIASGAEVIWRIPITSGSVIVSGNVSVSGYVMAKVSGEIVSVASGVVIASGLFIGNPGTATVQSGVYFASGIYVVTTPAGGGQVSGTVHVSGTVFTKEVTGTLISSYTTSGIKGVATQLPSVAGFAFVIVNDTNNANMWLGGSGIASGVGYLLLPGSSLSPPIDNLSRLYACAYTSGQRLSWMSIGY
jgi:hypothetical protein